MNWRVYLFALIIMVVFLSVSLANMQSNNPDSDDNATISGKTSEIIHTPVVTNRGQRLYENHCTSCHNDSVHSRNHSKAHSVDEIRQWVIRWSKYLELDWEKHDVDVVTDFLNQRIYHFTTEK